MFYHYVLLLLPDWTISIQEAGRTDWLSGMNVTGTCKHYPVDGTEALSTVHSALQPHDSIIVAYKFLRICQLQACLSLWRTQNRHLLTPVTMSLNPTEVLNIGRRGAIKRNTVLSTSVTGHEKMQLQPWFKKRRQQHKAPQPQTLLMLTHWCVVLCCGFIRFIIQSI